MSSVFMVINLNLCCLFVTGGWCLEQSVVDQMYAGKKKEKSYAIEESQIRKIIVWFAVGSESNYPAITDNIA